MRKNNEYFRYTFELFATTFWQNLERTDIFLLLGSFIFPAIIGSILQDWQIAVWIYLCIFPFGIARSAYKKYKKQAQMITKMERSIESEKENIRTDYNERLELANIPDMLSKIKNEYKKIFRDITINKLTEEQAKQMINIVNNEYKPPPKNAMIDLNSFLPIHQRNILAVKYSMKIVGIVDWNKFIQQNDELSCLKDKLFASIYTNKGKSLIEKFNMAVENHLVLEALYRIIPNGFLNSHEMVQCYIGNENSETIINTIQSEINAHIRKLILGETDD